MSDIDLPLPPDNLHDTGTYDEDNEIQDQSKLQSTSLITVDVEKTLQQVTDNDLNYLELENLEKALLKAELSDSQMYLKNIHTGFKFARSTRSLINLVGAGLAVHKHRRQILKDLKEGKKDPFGLDEHGNVKA